MHLTFRRERPGKFVLALYHWEVVKRAVVLSSIGSKLSVDIGTSLATRSSACSV